MLNEELYTTKSNEAITMFEKEPRLFDQYHEGFREQVKGWPQNPVDLMAKIIGKNPKWVVADMGCGDAKLAEAVPNKVHSFDLVAVNEKVVACDIAKVPLGHGEVDAVVFSLALMGTNYGDFVVEGHRILKKGGRMLIAEVRSRIEHVLDDFVTFVGELGFSVDKVEKQNKMFVFLQLTKQKDKPKGFDAGSAPVLKACQYKKR
mmetsp:Transcript_48846/g.117063  ORF Transcript_48846/g.117063 Transcript_48846/m.117063 type:complete len:204 (+) Transcript_48846:3-614(+)